MEDALSDYEQTLLFVSHDRYFIEKFATRVWAMGGGRVTDFRGGYREYCDWRDRQTLLNQSLSRQDREKKAKPQRGRSNAHSLERVEREIARLEQQSAELGREAEEHPSDYQRLMDISSRQEALESRLLALYGEWEELSQ